MTFASLGGAADAYGMAVLGYFTVFLAGFLTLCIAWVTCLETGKGWKWWAAGVAASLAGGLAGGFLSIFACVLVHPFGAPVIGALVGIGTGYAFYRKAAVPGSDAPPDP